MHQIIAKSKGWELILQGTVLNPVQSHAKCSFFCFFVLALAANVRFQHEVASQGKLFLQKAAKKS